MTAIAMRALCVVGTLVSVSRPNTVTAEVPTHRTITFTIHEVPSDPQSGVVWTIRLSITATTVCDTAVGWQVEDVWVEQHNDAYVPHRLWNDYMPLVNTSDGLWWIAHGDPMNPQPSEFTDLPALGGIASIVQNSTFNLEYVLEGASTPLSSPNGGAISQVRFSLACMGEGEPVDEGEDEPAEVTDEEDPPLGGD